MFTGIGRKIVGTLCVALVAAAIVAPSALSMQPECCEAAQEGYTPQALEALNQRWEAMAAYYGVEAADKSYSARALDAMNQRYDAMAKHYGVQSSLSGVKPDGYQPQLRGAEPTAIATSDDGFDWRTFGFATSGALLLLGFGGAAVITVRNRGRIAHP